MIDNVALLRDFLIASVAAPASSTLNANITASAASIVLAAGGGAGFPSNQNFVIHIGAEIIRVLSRAVDTLTVSAGGRGAMGTTAAAHLATTAVTQANLYSVVGANVYYPRIPDTVAGSEFKNDVPIIRFVTRGGRSDTAVEVHSPSYQFDCLGGSEDTRDHKAVYRMLHDRLQGQHGQATSNGQLISAIEEGIGQDLEYPDTKPPWPYTLAFFRVICGEIP